jgi:citrate synthase
MSIDTADVILRIGDQELACPVLHATEGSDAYDVSKLLKDTGRVTLDPGFVNTASCRSAITYIDGDAGILRYRGYPIEQLAENSTWTWLDPVIGLLLAGWAVYEGLEAWRGENCC